MVQNRIAQNQQLTAKKAEKQITYDANGAQVTLSANIVKRYLVGGNGAQNVSDEEVAMYINLCKYNNLNPWLKEVYCIKYGDAPATMVVGKEALTKRADAHPQYDGSEAGIITFVKEVGEVIYHKGSLRLPGEELIGGWAEVWRKDREHSTRVEVSLDEYIGRKKDGTPNDQWRNRAGTMIRKVALMQALREAFPSVLGGIYTAEEQGVSETDEPVAFAATGEAPERLGVEAPIEAQAAEVVPEISNNVHSALFEED